MHVMSPRRPMTAVAIAISLLAVSVMVAGLTTLAAADEPFVFAGAGDIAVTGPPGSHQIATAGRLAQIDPDAVFAAGDTQEQEGSSAEYAQSYDPTWGIFKPITVAVAGNHEWLTPGAAGWKAYFGLPSTYYQTLVNGWTVYVIDSNCAKIGGCGKKSAEYLWLKAQLQVSPASCIISIWHHPLFTSGNKHNPTVAMKNIWKLLDDNGGDIVINGHNGTYERFAQQNYLGVADPNGMREFEVGTGGNDRYDFDPVPMANSEVRLRMDGILALTLDTASYAWEFSGVDGAVADSGSGTC